MFESGEPRNGFAVLLVCACAIMSNAAASEDTTAPELAEPTPAAFRTKPGNVNIVAAGFTVDRILGKFEEQEIKVRARGKVPGQKIDTFIMRDVPARDALDHLVSLRPDWLIYERPDTTGTLEIWDQESFRNEVLPKQAKFKVYLPKYISAEESMKAIRGVLTPNIGTAAVDPRSNKLFVTDLPPVLELVERLLTEIDIQFVTRVFYLVHADVNSIGDKLSRMKSPGAPRPEVDERTRQIIVRDRMDTIRQMELLVETLDVPARAGTRGTPLDSWRVVRVKPDSLVLEDSQVKDGQGRAKLRELRKGQPTAVQMEGIDSTVTLTQVPDGGTTEPGAVAVFRVEQGPQDVRLLVR